MKSVIPVRIAGTGSAAPARIVTNDDLAKAVQTSDEWIRERTGIRQRRIAGPDETPSSLGAEAARQALQAAQIPPEEIDLIICATSNPDHLLPTTSCTIQHRLGCVNAGAVDMLAACTGFIYALSSAYRHVATGGYRHVLCVGAETLSRMVNWEDRTTCVLFGDAAGAVVLTPSQDSSDILYTHLGADGSQGDLIMVPAGCSAEPLTHERLDQKRHTIHMKGREVYKFAVTKMYKLIEEAMERCHLRPEDVSLVIPHQVNLRIIESAAERVKIPLERIYINIDRYGNTSAASVPVALDEAVRTGRLKRGDVAILVAFGGGLTWGSAVLRY